MGTSIKPVFYTCKETKDYTDHLADNIKMNIGSDADLLLDHPAIYVHVWQSKNDRLNNRYSIYIGESNDLVERTKEHWYAAKIPKQKRKKGNWQYHMCEDVDINGKKVIPTVYFFGHQYFQKSLTLDIENRLIDYCYAMETANVYNGRTNPQGYYAGDEDLDQIFSMIWKELRNQNKELFLSENDIQKSAIYKASPNHKLTDDQKKAKQLIIERTVEAVLNEESGQLIFVEGEAGTGKTVLTASTFYSILENDLLKDLDIQAAMLINHNEQRTVYENIARKLGYDEEIIQNPTTFLKSHSILDSKGKVFLPDLDNMADIVFIDEAHLLWNQRNQAFDRRFLDPQLDEIIKRSRVTVIMFDDNQVLHKGQVYQYHYMDEKRKLAKSQGPDPLHGDSNYIELINQLRMNCSSETMDWVDAFSKDLVIEHLHLGKGNKDSKGYEVAIFNDPAAMHTEIINRAKQATTQLSRMVATVDWEYINSCLPGDKQYWDICIGSWSIPWNEQIYWADMYYQLNKRERKRYAQLDWAEKDYSIMEAGSTFTIQGFDLAYVGVILGPSVRYDSVTKKIWFDESYRTQDYMKGVRKFDDGTSMNITDLISKHELRVLLTRGTKGLFLYACDSELRAALNECII